jgi:hypothetical protein
MKYIELSKIRSIEAYSLYGKGLISTKVPVKVIEDFDWVKNAEVREAAGASKESVEDFKHNNKEIFSPCYLIGKDGKEYKNKIGIGGAFFIQKKDIKEKNEKD